MPARELDQVQDALTRSAERLTRRPHPTSLDETLSRLARAAVDTVPGADYAGWTMRRKGGTLESLGVSHPDIADLDRLQAELGEGPCVDAARCGDTSLTVVDDLADEAGRWPKFAPEAAGRGVHSLLSFAVAPRDASPGALNLYSCDRAMFGIREQAIADAFATQAAVAVYGAETIAGLNTAVASRDVIGQAKGILMERHRVDATSAFDMLVSASQDTNIKLAEVARWLVEQSTST